MPDTNELIKELLEGAEETLEAVNHTEEEILRDREGRTLDEGDLEALDHCWHIKEEVSRVLHVCHECKAHMPGTRTV